MTQKRLDPIVLEVLWNRLVSVVEEQAQTRGKVGAWPVQRTSKPLKSAPASSKSVSTFSTQPRSVSPYPDDTMMGMRGNRAAIVPADGVSLRTSRAALSS